MDETDYPEFSTLLDAVCSLLSRGAYAPSPTNTALWFRALRDHSLDDVSQALDAHVQDPQRGRFVPVPADVIAQLQGQAAGDGRPGADEAWSNAITARDENETVVWTAEMAEAWGIASAVMTAGDETGARMAFRQAYDRLVAEARRAGARPTWQASLGHDPDRRNAAVAAAVDAGRLRRSTLIGLPAPRGQYTPLLESDFVADEISPGVADKARHLLRAIADRLRTPPPAGPSAAEVEAWRVVELKANTARKVAEYTTGQQGAAP